MRWIACRSLPCLDHRYGLGRPHSFLVVLNCRSDTDRQWEADLFDSPWFYLSRIQIDFPGFSGLQRQNIYVRRTVKETLPRLLS